LDQSQFRIAKLEKERLLLIRERDHYLETARKWKLKAIKALKPSSLENEPMGSVAQQQEPQEQSLASLTSSKPEGRQLHSALSRLGESKVLEVWLIC